jgi:hypothetical protein
MKTVVWTIISVLAVLFSGCANRPATSIISPQDPIFPRTSSILPLEKNNKWVYSYTAYDSAGKKILPHRLDLHIGIPLQYGIQHDTGLVLLDKYNYQDTFQAYAYQYEMEDRGMGYLVVYRDLYPLSIRGLYIIGEYNDTSIRQYPHEQLWLAYPADSGKTWRFQSDPLNDTNAITTMEIISTNARFYCPDNSSMTGLSVYDSCYLYKESSGDTVDYYYYNKNVGALGYQRSIGGTLRETYILKSFTNQ